MQRKTVIKNIEKIIVEHGCLNLNIIGIDKPIYKQLGKETHIIEGLYGNDVEVVSYVNETETGIYNVDYNELTTDTLNEILMILDDYEVEQEKFFESCLDENF